MHDTHLLRNILKYFESQEKLSSRKIKRVHFSVSEFGSLNKEHFLEHYRLVTESSRWQDLEITVDLIPFGPELEITGLDFVEETEAEKSEICESKENKS